MSINVVVLHGNLTRDPESIADGNGVKFAVAVNEKFTDKNGERKERVGYFDVAAWGKQAGPILEYLRKGSQVIVNGRLVQDRWQNDQGENRSKVGINAFTVQFIGQPPKNGDAVAAERSAAEDEDDDLPF